MRAFPKFTRFEGSASGIVVVIAVGITIALVFEATSIAIGLLGLLLILTFVTILQIRRRVGDIRSRLGAGIAQIRQDVERGTGGAGTTGDVAYRRILSSLESERLEAAERYAETHSLLTQLRAEVARNSDEVGGAE